MDQPNKCRFCGALITTDRQDWIGPVWRERPSAPGHQKLKIVGAIKIHERLELPERLPMRGLASGIQLVRVAINRTIAADLRKRAHRAASGKM